VTGLAYLRRLLRPASPPPPILAHPHLDYPALTAAHFSNARAFADRAEMVPALKPEPGLVIGEVGIGLGTFSRFVIDHLQPARFVAFDLFDLHTLAELWGKPTHELFGGRSHRAFYEALLADAGARLVIEEGPSEHRPAAQPDRSFDILYIDADHGYDGVKRDISAALPKMKPDGLLVFNDYTLFDHDGHPYGVVKAVNELVTSSDWKVVGFSLQRWMYCDIALRRGGG